jgi:hypothetical protein
MSVSFGLRRRLAHLTIFFFWSVRALSPVPLTKSLPQKIEMGLGGGGKNRGGGDAMSKPRTTPASAVCGRRLIFAAAAAATLGGRRQPASAALSAAQLDAQYYFKNLVGADGGRIGEATPARDMDAALLRRLEDAVFRELAAALAASSATLRDRAAAIGTKYEPSFQKRAPFPPYTPTLQQSGGTASPLDNSRTFNFAVYLWWKLAINSFGDNAVDAGVSAKEQRRSFAFAVGDALLLEVLTANERRVTSSSGDGDSPAGAASPLKALLSARRACSGSDSKSSSSGGSGSQGGSVSMSMVARASEELLDRLRAAGFVTNYKLEFGGGIGGGGSGSGTGSGGGSGSALGRFGGNFGGKEASPPPQNKNAGSGKSRILSEEAIDEAQDDWSGGFPVELRVELSESASVGASLQLAGENEPFRPDLAGLAREYIWRMILLTAAAATAAAAAAAAAADC